MNPTFENKISIINNSPDPLGELYDWKLMGIPKYEPGRGHFEWWLVKE